MILAVLDDLMFSSKIKMAAKQLGAPVSFARSAPDALVQMRASTPSLLVVDLNCARADPLGLVTSMKKEAALAAIPILGYVSHVHTQVIEAARQAGVDEILARSAFSEQLADILKR